MNVRRDILDSTKNFTSSFFPFLSKNIINDHKFLKLIQIDNTLISLDILENVFFCDLSKCFGACCIDGESGAPLEESELKEIEDCYPIIKKYLTKTNQETVREKGYSYIDSDGDLVTTLVGKDECAFTIKENGITYCSFERAFRKNEIGFHKPISCHLYPIRITKYKDFEALNYDRQENCIPGCEKGKQSMMPLYLFLKEPLVRKYGEAWFDALCESVEELKEMKKL